MNSWKRKVIKITCLIFTASFLSSCGGQAYNTGTSNANLGTTSTPASSGNTTTTTPSTPTNLYTHSPVSFAFQNQASSPTSLCPNPTPANTNVGSFSIQGIQTDNALKVTVTAGPPSALPCNSTGSTKSSIPKAEYSCVQYTITSGSHTEYPMVSYGNPTVGPCAGAPSSVTLDFSDQTGYGPVDITVTNAAIDNCRLFL